MITQQQKHNPDDPSDEISTVLRLFCGLGFTTMLVMAANSTFHNNVSNYIANKEQYWKVLHIPQDSSIHYQVYQTRSEGKELIISKNDTTLYTASCRKIKAFCLGVKDKTLTPTGLDFYARYESTAEHVPYNQLLLKTVYYTDHNQIAQSANHALETPSSVKSLQKSKKGFIGFFIQFYLLYSLALVFIYFNCMDDDKQREKSKMRLFNFIALVLGINYLYFIIQYLIQI